MLSAARRITGWLETPEQRGADVAQGCGQCLPGCDEVVLNRGAQAQFFSDLELFAAADGGVLLRHAAGFEYADGER